MGLIEPLIVNLLDIFIPPNISFAFFYCRGICPTPSVSESTERKPTVHVLFGEVHGKSISHLV